MAVLPVGQEPAHYGRPSLLPVTTSHHIFTAVTFNLVMGPGQARGGYGHTATMSSADTGHTFASLTIDMRIVK